MDYLAPEVFMQGKYGKEADVWSMGIIFFEILTGKRIRQMRKEGLIDKGPPGQIKGFFSPVILGMIKNERQRKFVEGMLDEKTESRSDS
jgi:serine/threonine protein kinase